MRGRWLILGALAAFVVLCLGGWLLPSEWRVERSVLIDADRRTVFWFVNTHEGWVEWSEWAQEVDPSIEFADAEGITEGAGMELDWYAAGEPTGVLRIVESEPPEHVGYVMRLPQAGLELHGDLQLDQEAGGTRVTWTERGDLGFNPLVRWLRLLGGDAIGEDFERGLQALKEDAEGAAAQEPAPIQPLLDPGIDPEVLPPGDGAGAAYEGM